MSFDNVSQKPAVYYAIMQESKATNFSLYSDTLTGSLLRSLVGSKPAGQVLELGTGTGLAQSWMASGAHASTIIVSIENDPTLVSTAKGFFASDPRVEIVCEDGGEWIRSYTGAPFDLIFADAWPGKIELLSETLDLIAPGGIYFVDDLSPQANWPEGHDKKVENLTQCLSEMSDFSMTRMNWSTGLLIATKLK